LWRQVLFPATERIRILIKENAGTAAIAREIERALWTANHTYGSATRNMLDRWMLSVDDEVRRAITQAQHQALGVDLSEVLARPDVADALAIAGQQASMLIASIPQDYLGKVAQAVADNFSGRPLPENRSLLEQIQHIGGVSYRRAKLIARDQTSKLTAALNEQRQTAIGVETYIWRTVKDNRVVGNPTGRYPDGNSKHGDHYDLNGKLCKWDDPTVYSEDDGKTWKPRPKEWSQNHPGIDIQCRCWAQPIISPERIIEFIKAKRNVI
jgi:uncharacterized protein with gpF-like domain